MARGGRDERGRPRRERPGALRLQIASHLPWLGCYPEAIGGGEVRWRDPIAGATCALDRAALAAATRTVNRLVRDHADALAAAVGDVARWRAAVLAILDALKPAIHDGAAAPTVWTPALHPAAAGRRARAIVAATPGLAPLVEALGWIHAVDHEAGPALAWIERRAHALDGLDVTLALQLRHLAAHDGERLVDPLIAALADRALHAVSPHVGTYAKLLEPLIGDPSRTPPRRPPRAPIGPKLRALVPWLVARPATERRLSLRAIAAARLPETAAMWGEVWRRVDGIVHRLTPPRAPSSDQLLRIGRELAELQRELPRDLHLDELLTTLRAPAPALLDVLDRMTDLEPGTHAAALVELHLAPHRPATIPALAAMLDACLDDAPGGARALWRRVLGSGTHLWANELPDAVDDARLVGRALALLLPEATHATPRELAVIARHRREPAAIVAHWRVWDRYGHLTTTEIELGLALTATPDELRWFTGRMSSRHRVEELDELRPLLRALGPGGGAIVRALLEAGELSRVHAAACTAATCASLGVPVPRFAAPDDVALPAALARYPAELHASLARLAAAGAAPLAAGILDDTFPEPRATARELAAIEARLAGGAGDVRLRRRADNLRARLAAPPPASAVRVARLRDKLERAAALAALDRWHAELRRASDVLVRRRLGLADGAERPPWLDAPRYHAVLDAIGQLPARPLALARRLLARRAGPPPWDLRDVGFNRAWLDQLAARGVDVGPWLDGIGPRRRGQVTLALEDDPLEVLRMGEHFSTCLSPDAFNFFSAVVNAAEINKRVIYGRDPDGAVVGRCLVALTDEGGLVTFQPYSHGRGTFGPWVADFVRDLAARMRTAPVPRGRIRALAGCGWYDDGAHDLTGAFAFLDDGSAFRAGLATVPLDQLVAELTARFAPLPLDGLALALFVHLPELDARPALIIPCLPLLDDARDVAFATRLHAARLAERAGRGDLLGERFITRFAGWSGWFEALDLVRLLAPRVPGRMLTWLNRARRDLAPGQAPAWHCARGLALAALRRPAQAARELEAAAASDGAAAKAARRALASLGGR